MTKRLRHRELSQARAEETRALILQKAREAFAEYGFVGANVRDIARAANTTHSMITYHFGTKEQLWREAVRDMFAVLDRSMRSWRTAGLDPGQLRNVFMESVRDYVRYCAQHPEHARITITEAIRGGERLRWMVDEFVQSDHAEAIDLLNVMMDAGIIRRLPMVSLLYAYVGMAQLPFALAEEARLARGHDFTREAAIEEHARTVMALMMVDPPTT